MIVNRVALAQAVIDTYGHQLDALATEAGSASLKPSFHCMLHRQLLGDGIDLETADALIDALVDRLINLWTPVLH